jgi:hypothetical protein
MGRVTQDDVLFGYRLQVFGTGRPHIGRGGLPHLRHPPLDLLRLEDQVERGGLEMLRPRERRRPQMPNQPSAMVEERIVAFSLAHPGLGPKKVAAELGRPKWGGLVVSPNGAYKTLLRHGLNTAQKRLSPIAGYRAPYEPEPDPDPERHIEVERPGELVGMDCFYVGPAVRASPEGSGVSLCANSAARPHARVPSSCGAARSDDPAAARLRRVRPQAISCRRVAPDALAAHPPLGGAHPLGHPPQGGGGEAAEQRERHERPEARDRSGARPGDAERRFAQRDPAETRVGHAQAHSADPLRGLIRAAGGAQQQHDSERIRLLAGRAEHAVQRPVPQMVEHGEGEPGVGEEQLWGAELGAGLHGATVGGTAASRIVRSG